MSLKSLLLLPVAIVLFLGLSPEVSELLRINPFARGLSGVQRLIYPMLALFAPLVLVLAMLRLTRFRLSQTMGSILLVLVMVYGILATIILSAGAGASSGNALVHGFALTFALSGMVAFMVHGPMYYWGGNLAIVLLALSFVVATFSLAGIPASILQTMKLAGDRPYCLATRAADNYTLRSVPDLRNMSLDMFLVPDLTGRIDLYPNHILMVSGAGGRDFHYWSPASSRFYPVTPEFPANGRLGSVCQPQRNFLMTLRPV